jgi:hypothetical protein
MHATTADKPSMYRLPHLQIELEDIAILREIGSGNAGVVFEATIASLNNGEKVALKVVSTSMGRRKFMHVNFFAVQAIFFAV